MSPTREGCDSGSIFRPRSAGLHLVALLLDLLPTKSKKLSRLYYLPIAGAEKRLINSFLKGIGAKWNAIYFVQNLNLGRRVLFSKTITVTTCTYNVTIYCCMDTKKDSIADYC